MSGDVAPVRTTGSVGKNDIFHAYRHNSYTEGSVAAGPTAHEEASAGRSMASLWAQIHRHRKTGL